MVGCNRCCKTPTLRSSEVLVDGFIGAKTDAVNESLGRELLGSQSDRRSRAGNEPEG